MKPASAPEMDELIDETRGLQPLRRLFHALTGVTVAAGLAWLDLSRPTVLLVLGGGASLLLVLDLLRLRLPRANAAFFRNFRHLASPREADALASSTWYAVSLFLTVALFPLEAAVSGILVLALADPAASYVGRRWGRRPLLGGSVEGSLVFLAVAGVVLVLRHAWPAAGVGALLALLAERLSGPLDDNLTLPPVAAGAVLLVERLL